MKPEGKATWRTPNCQANTGAAVASVSGGHKLGDNGGEERKPIRG